MQPEDFRHATHPGDFELESLHIEDSLITIYQPGGQRPYNYSIFNAVIGPFRKRWLFYDLMCAESITGQMDNCLFSLHMPQKLGKVSGDEDGVKRMVRQHLFKFQCLFSDTRRHDSELTAYQLNMLNMPLATRALCHGSPLDDWTLCSISNSHSTRKNH